MSNSELQKKVSFIFSCIFILTFIVGMLAFPIYAIVEPSSSFYVNDYANVLDTDTEQEIIDSNGTLENQCNGAQVVVVTVNYLDGMSSDEYAMQLFNDWGIGSSSENNGVLILLAISENKYYIQYGRGLNDTDFEDVISGNIDTFESEFDAKMYDDAVDTLFNNILDWFENYYHSSITTGEEQNSSGRLGTIIGIVAFICFVYWLISVFTNVSSGHGGRRGGRRIFFWPTFGNSAWNNTSDDFNHHGDSGGFGGFGGNSGGGFGGSGSGGGGFGGGGFGRN